MTIYTKKIKSNLAVLKRTTDEKNADRPKIYPAVLPYLPKGEHWDGWEKYGKEHPEEEGQTLTQQMANATNRASGAKKGKGMMNDWIEKEKRIPFRYNRNKPKPKPKPAIQEE